MFARNLGRVSPSIFTVTVPVTGDTTNIDLNTESLQRGWNGAKRLRSFVTVNNNVTVTSLSSQTPALNVNLRENDFVRVVNNGTIAGAPGEGGDGGLDAPGQNGQSGGDAIVITANTEIINNGTIAPGGGGSGGDGGVRTPFSSFAYWAFASCPQGSLNRAGGLCGVCAFTVRVPRGKGFVNETRFVNANCYPVYNYGVTTARGSRGSSGQRGVGFRGGSGRTNAFEGGAGGPPGRPIRILRPPETLRIINNGTVVQPQT